MRTLLIVAALLLSACGFQLRGKAELPFETLYMPPANAPGIVLDLRRAIQTGTSTRLVDDPKAAQAQLEFSQEARDKEILSLSSAGRVREYQLRYRVAFRVHDGKGNEYLPLRRVQLSREITFSDADILAKETEEQLLFRDMQSDMVQQIMRLVAASTPPKPVPQ
jgi:LPS-assembly lipoprotein